MTQAAAKLATAGGAGTATAPPAIGRPAGWFLKQFKISGTDFERIAARAIRQPELIPALIAGCGANTPPVRLGSAKALWLVAQDAPELLYPHFDFFLSQLDNGNSILRWNATRTLACLAPVDRNDRLAAALDKYLSPIRGPQMIGAAMAIRWASTIALAKPELADRIASGILGVREAVYATPECRNVAAGHAIESICKFFHLIRAQEPVVRFVRAEIHNSRAATRKKAQRFLKRHAGWKPGACGRRPCEAGR